MDNTNSLPFDYVVTATTGAAAGSTVSTTLIMQADSRFELMAILATGGANATTEDSLQYPNSFTVSIRDQTTGRDLMSAPVPQRILCGNAYKQLAEKRGIIFEPQSNLLFTFTNLAGGAANNITLVLKGYKIIL
jgi:hypothetical protein